MLHSAVLLTHFGVGLLLRDCLNGRIRTAQYRTQETGHWKVERWELSCENEQIIAKRETVGPDCWSVGLCSSVQVLSSRRNGLAVGCELGDRDKRRAAPEGTEAMAIRDVLCQVLRGRSAGR